MENIHLSPESRKEIARLIVKRMCLSEGGYRAVLNVVYSEYGDASRVLDRLDDDLFSDEQPGILPSALRSIYMNIQNEMLDEIQELCSDLKMEHSYIQGKRVQLSSIP